MNQINQLPRRKYWATRSSIRSFVRSHRSLIRLLHFTRFDRALRCAHSLACGTVNVLMPFILYSGSQCVVNLELTRRVRGREGDLVLLLFIVCLTFDL